MVLAQDQSTVIQDQWIVLFHEDVDVEAHMNVIFNICKVISSDYCCQRMDRQWYFPRYQGIGNELPYFTCRRKNFYCDLFFSLL